MSKFIQIIVDDIPCKVSADESLAVALSRQTPLLRHSPNAQSPRGQFCGMGMCFECMLTVDGIARRSCLTPVVAGMRVVTGRKNSR